MRSMRGWGVGLWVVGYGGGLGEGSGLRVSSFFMFFAGRGLGFRAFGV